MNAKKLLSTLLSAAMAVSMLAGCFGGGGNKNYSDEAADAANAAQSTVVFATDAKLSKSLQDALENFTQLDDIKDAMEADENLKSLLTSGYDLDVVAEQGEDAEAAAKAIAEKYIVSIVSGKKAEGKIAMVLHDGNGYYYVAVLTYGSGGSGSGGGAGGGSGSGEGGQGGGTTPGTDPDEPGPDDDENNPGGGDDDVIYYSVTTNAQGGNGHYNTPSRVEKGQELSFTVTADKGYEAVVTATMGDESIGLTINGDRYTYSPVTDDIVIDITFAKKAPEQFILNMGVNDVDGGNVYADIDGDGKKEVFLGDTFVTAGEDFTFTVTPNDGYEALVSAVDADGMPVKVIDYYGNYTINEVNSDIEVTVTFVEKVPSQYMVNVSVNDTNGGTVSADIDGDGKEEDFLGDTFVTAGEDFTFTVTPNDGYEALVSAVDADGMPVKVIDYYGNYTINEVNSDIEVTVTFVEKVPSQYMVNVSVNDTNGGTVSADINGDGKEEGCLGDSFVNAGDDFDFTVTPAEGYEIYSVTVERGNGRFETLALTANNKYTASKIESDTDITVTFAPIQVTVTLQIEGDGSGTVTFNRESIEDGESIIVDFKDEVAIEATPGTDSELVSISDGSNNLKNGATIYPSGNITITVTFESTEPVLTSIDVKQTGTIYVDEKISGSDLTVTAYDQNGKEMEVTLEFVSASPNSFDTAGPHKNVSVTYKDKDGKQYIDKNVTITVKAPYVTGIKVTNTPAGATTLTVTREWRTSHVDEVFRVWKWDYISPVGFGSKGHYEYCDDIELQVNYSDGSQLKINKKNLEEYLDKSLTATPNTFKWADHFKSPVMVTIRYQEPGMTKPVETSILVEVVTSDFSDWE